MQWRIVHDYTHRNSLGRICSMSCRLNITYAHRRQVSVRPWMFVLMIGRCMLSLKCYMCYQLLNMQFANANKEIDNYHTTILHIWIGAKYMIIQHIHATSSEMRFISKISSLLRLCSADTNLNRCLFTTDNFHV